jgi:hypothetical protein
MSQKSDAEKRVIEIPEIVQLAMRNGGKERSYEQEAENIFNIFHCTSSIDGGVWRVAIAGWLYNIPSVLGHSNE